MKPTDFRAGGANTEIHFAIGECSLGSILVARSGKGICAILLGDDPDALVRELQDRFPQAPLLGGDRRVRGAGRQGGRLRRSAARSVSTCRSTCAARRSSSASGRRCRRFRRARPRATPTSPSGSARPRRCGRWRRPARPTTSRWRSLPSGGAHRRCPVRLSVGRASASAPCSSGRPRHERAGRVPRVLPTERTLRAARRSTGRHRRGTRRAGLRRARAPAVRRKSAARSRRSIRRTSGSAAA